MVSPAAASNTTIFNKTVELHVCMMHKIKLQLTILHNMDYQHSKKARPQKHYQQICDKLNMCIVFLVTQFITIARVGFFISSASGAPKQNAFIQHLHAKREQNINRNSQEGFLIGKSLESNDAISAWCISTLSQKEVIF